MVAGGHTRNLLLAVARDGADDSVDLAAYAVGRALDVLLCLGGVVFGLARGVLLLAGLRPGGGASQVTDRLDDGALERVVLPGGLAEEMSARLEDVRLAMETHLGSLVFVELDMMRSRRSG